MDLDTLILTVFCTVDDALDTMLNGETVRQRGPQPLLSDAEVLTMETVGEYLGMDQDKAIFAYFRRHYGHFFPTVCRIHRTTFARQAANLWRVKERLWQHLSRNLEVDRAISLIDSFPSRSAASLAPHVAADCASWRPMVMTNLPIRPSSACAHICECAGRE